MTKRSRHNLSRRTKPALGALILLTLAACGSSGDGGTGGGASTPAAEPSATTGSATGAAAPAAAAWPSDKCSIVPAADVGAAVGDEVEATNFPPFGCQYKSSDIGSVIEYYRLGVECEGVESRDPDARVVAGLGAHAVFAAGNTDEVLAVTTDDGRCFFVHGTYPRENDALRRAVAEAVLRAV